MKMIRMLFLIVVFQLGSFGCAAEDEARSRRLEPVARVPAAGDLALPPPRSPRGNEVHLPGDDDRPMIGTHVMEAAFEAKKKKDGASVPTVAARMRLLRGTFDFVQIRPYERKVRVTEGAKLPLGVQTLEHAKIPWVGVWQMPVPIGRYDQRRWDIIAKRCQQLADLATRCNYVVGWNDQSEPHFNPFAPRYCANTPEEIFELGLHKPFDRQFVQWIEELYEDRSPAEDTNCDGITFNRDFAVKLRAWNQVNTMANKDKPFFQYCQDMFRRGIVATGVAERCRLAEKADPARPTVTRLLASKYPRPKFGTDLRQLGIGGTKATGVTFYQAKSSFNDLFETRCRWFVSLVDPGVIGPLAFILHPPWQTGPGIVACEWTLDIPSGKKAALRYTFLPPGKKSDGVGLRISVKSDFGPYRQLYHHRYTPQEGRRDENLSLAKYAGQRIKLLMELDPGSKRSSTDDSCSMSRAVIEINGKPAFNLASLYLAGKARMGTALFANQDTNGRLGLKWHWTAPDVWKFDADGCQVWSSLVANRAALSGKRWVINEFHPTGGYSATVTPAVLAQSLLTASVGQPAGIVFFTWSGPGKKFARFDISPWAETIARLRNQLALHKPYRNIKQPKKLAVFVPSYLPEHPEWFHSFNREALCRALAPWGGQVYTLDDIREAGKYRCAIVLLGFHDADSEPALANFLRNPPDGTKVIVLCLSNRILTTPGKRLSQRYDEALSGILPVCPIGGDVKKSRVTVDKNLSLEIGTAEDIVVTRPAERKVKLLKDNRGKVVGFAKDRFLQLAGNVNDKDLPRLIESVLGPASAIADFGSIKIVRGKAVGKQPGLYALREEASLQIPSDMIGWDLARDSIVEGNIINGPGAVAIHRRRDTNLVSTGLSKPVEILRQDGQIRATLFSPMAFVKKGFKAAIVADRKPQVLLDGSKVDIKKQGHVYLVRWAKPGPHVLEIK